MYLSWKQSVHSFTRVHVHPKWNIDMKTFLCESIYCHQTAFYFNFFPKIALVFNLCIMFSFTLLTAYKCDYVCAFVCVSVWVLSVYSSLYIRITNFLPRINKGNLLLLHLIVIKTKTKTKNSNLFVPEKNMSYWCAPIQIVHCRV